MSDNKEAEITDLASEHEQTEEKHPFADDLKDKHEDLNGKSAVAKVLSEATSSSSSSSSAASTSTSTTTETKSSAPMLAPEQLEKLLKQLSLGGKIDIPKEHKFWKTQPVLQTDEKVTDDDVGPIEPDNQNVRKEPYALPADFEWVSLDINTESQLKELYQLLNENYVEDDDNMFRFDYSPEFLKWALLPPGWKQSWHAAVRVKSNQKLVGFISAIPATLQVKKRTQKLVEINFLCVHKKLRSKRLAPVLIKEITRRVHLEGLFQAVYTAGTVIPKTFCTCRYYHRSLNPKKLIEIGFSHLQRNMTLKSTIKLYKLPETTSTPGLRPMTAADAPAVFRLVTNYLAKFSVKPLYTEEECEYWLVPRTDVIESFVVENPSTHEITDFISFYILPSTIVNNANYKTLKAAYSYYNVANSVPLVTLMNDALILATQRQCDVFNALDLMDNEPLFKELKFGVGDGRLQYYLYNLKCPEIPAKELALVLL